MPDCSSSHPDARPRARTPLLGWNSRAGRSPPISRLNWTEAELGLTVRRGFSTHWHDDRLGGAAVLDRRGIPFFAHPRTRAIAETEDLPIPAPIADPAPGETVAFGLVEIFYPGPGHTPDNTMIWLPEMHMLFGGCAVKSAAVAGLGYTGDADLEAWPDAIARAQSRYPEVEVVVPGHGAIGDAELLAHTRALLGN
ncbi:MAG: MBL fold metallo-hydrolase [Rhodothermaceae bacterium]|nr:MBL fold metallo-hydrolase [Rhodothermaceae bacterium]